MDTSLVVLERENVSRFRGVEMPELLERLESEDPHEWRFVRNHVFPPPPPPVSDSGRRNYAWPPANPANPNQRQRAWRSYLLWPEHVRTLLQADDWNHEENRRRLARLGRMYRIIHRFQNTPEYQSPTRESEHWREFAETMLAYGEDGRDMLISNMILALTNPSENVIFQAQEILVLVGGPAIERLCAALWTTHNQLVEYQDEQGRTHVRITTNANFPKHIVDTLYRIGPRAASQAIYELENGPTDGSSWRFRRHFVELLGRFRDPRAVRAIGNEIDRVNIAELDRDALAQGRDVIDRAATDHANFVYREYLLKALGEIGSIAGLGAVVRLWELDADHEAAALEATLKITGRRVRSLDEVRELANRHGAETDE